MAGQRDRRWIHIATAARVSELVCQRSPEESQYVRYCVALRVCVCTAVCSQTSGFWMMLYFYTLAIFYPCIYTPRVIFIHGFYSCFLLLTLFLCGCSVILVPTCTTFGFRVLAACSMPTLFLSWCFSYFMSPCVLVPYYFVYITCTLFMEVSHHSRELP